MNIFTSTNPMDLENLGQPIYLTAPYLQSQSYHDFHACISKKMILAFDVREGMAISLPKSPFGSTYGKKSSNSEWIAFLEDSRAALSEMGIHSLQMNHPSQIYSGFIPEGLLTELGSEIKYIDINQQIELSAGWEDRIHSMQKRKLEKLEIGGFVFRKMNNNEDFRVAYDFVKVCRQTQGLQINIEWNHLDKLRNALPEAYQAFGVYRENKISAVCIAVEVTPGIAYYYLPATSPMFRSESPMVMLIAGMVDYYRSQGFDYLDLGVSSVQGKPQETLRVFKERMGAKESGKTTYLLSW